ncbi:hypothetical protein BDR03DRAFT_987187 [Suillus americanus]|nr:hypothetical protein BDR03DRAFT_987187 [Suillus americanus]
MSLRLGDWIDAITEVFNIVGISVSQFLIDILSNNNNSNNEIVVDLLNNGHHIMELLVRHSQLETTQKWASNIISDVCVQEIGDLSAKKHGSHFAVSLVLPQFSSEPWFEPELFRTGLMVQSQVWHGPWTKPYYLLASV